MGERVTLVWNGLAAGLLMSYRCFESMSADRTGCAAGAVETTDLGFAKLCGKYSENRIPVRLNQRTQLIYDGGVELYNTC